MIFQVLCTVVDGGAAPVWLGDDVVLLYFDDSSILPIVHIAVFLRQMRQIMSHVWCNSLAGRQLTGDTEAHFVLLRETPFFYRSG